MANAPDKHAVLSPSSAHRWTRCPGSVALNLAFPDRPAGKYADEGTAAHEVAAWALQDKEHDCHSYVGRETSNGWVFTEAMAEYTQPYVDAVLEASLGNTLMVEQPLDISPFTGEDGASGTGDAIIISWDGSELQVHDLKTGRGERVYAFENDQLSLYALAALDKYSMLGDFKTVKLVIHQPRLDVFDEWLVTVDDLKDFASKVAESAKVAREHLNTGNPEFEDLCAGEKQCRWCKKEVQNICPAFNNQVVVAILHEPESKVSQEELSALAEDNIRDAIAKVKALSGDELAARMNILHMVDMWVKAVRDTVEERLAEGESVSGYKLVEGRAGNRAWADEAAAETLLKSSRVKAADMYVSKLISPSQAEKLLKREKPVVWKRVEELITRGEGKPTVALASDKRPALVLKPQAEEVAALSSTADDLI